jgi:PTS system mannitol-specific IIA component
MPITSAVLSSDKIVVDARPADKRAAIEAVGNLLVSAGHVTPDYLPAMFEREAAASTYVGNGVAIPHGTHAAIAFVRSPGIALLHVPRGVDFGDGNTVRLVFGLAARGDEHLAMLTAVAEVCSDDARLARLLAAGSAGEILAVLQAALPA